jgi:ANTAR domain
MLARSSCLDAGGGEGRTMTMTIDALVDVMEDVAGSFDGTVSVDETLPRITASAVSNVPGAEYASISIRRVDGLIETLASTGRLALEADLVQYRLKEGPCYETVTGGPTLTSGRLGSDSRWPLYGPEVARLGVRSQLAVLLSHDSETLGLNLYSTVADSLDDVDGIAELFAIYVRAILGHAQDVENWVKAVDSRTLTGQATGILMERYHLSPAAAFDFLIRISQTTNTKLRTIAADIVKTAANRA